MVKMIETIAEKAEWENDGINLSCRNVPRGTFLRVKLEKKLYTCNYYQH